MRRVIDIHAHLGDLYHTNQNVIWKLNIEQGNYKNQFQELEDADFNKPLITHPDELPMLLETSQKLCLENTLENLTKRLNINNIDYICLYPIHPNTTFEEYLAASRFEPRILPFTSIDFSLSIEEIVRKLMLDIEKGAVGLKIHPIMQNISLKDSKVRAAVEVYGMKKIPIISHCGINEYYTKDKTYPHNPAYGDLMDFIELAKDYPNYILIAGHAGGLSGGEMEILHEHCGDMENVYVDTTFRSYSDIRKLVEYFGENRVLYGTDLPFSTHTGSIKQVEKAFPENADLRDKILYRNSAKILGINC